MRRTSILATLFPTACIVLAAAALSLSGCRSLLIGKLVNPSYSLRGVMPHVAIALPLSASAIDFDITIGVDNPNSIGLHLDWLEFDLAINDIPILTSVRADQGVNIPAHGVGDIHLRTRVGYANLKALFRQVADMVQGNRAHYAIHGNAYYHTPFGEKRYPVTLYSRGPRGSSSPEPGNQKPETRNQKPEAR
ncbi:MAG TPA: LEA type 2 family protein [Thermoanaerobaculia bacterium]|jgi:LEA14-like dessication related protein|nr:LEA type 2 family protein [Thermoanaerobaculia bacterium]